jgi:hypothetical protein
MEAVEQQAQLDKAERSHLEDIVKKLRERAEQTVDYWIDTKLNLSEEDADPPAGLSEKMMELREKVRSAIEREQAGERSWAKARDLYAKGVGYTLVNRLAALRCMEVRGFIERSPTRFRADEVTPAAGRFIDEYFMRREDALWTAFLVACHERSEEIEILFDLSDPYSLLYGKVADWDGEPEERTWSDELQSSFVDLLQDLSGLLDQVDDAVWRADDVLGWVYEYYNVPDLDSVRSNVETKEDTIAANQFYTPHWVVRMLVDNSLGKLYLEHDNSLEEAIEYQKQKYTAEERKERIPSLAEAPSVADLCTYLVPTEEEGEPTDTLAEEGPEGLRVFDPASGSAHFLLYAFDVLERIWRAETDLDHGEIPEKILKHNLYGVDLDLRACQLATFNLYLKARSRAEEEGNEDFQMPDVRIVCADAHVADLDRSHTVFDEVAEDDHELRDALDSILNAFEHIEGLGSLLDVRGTLAELIDESGGQLDVFKDEEAVTLPQLLERLHDAVAEHVEGGSFRAKDLRSFLRLLVVLSQDYDVSLMNPPYGSGNRMPDDVQEYVEGHYDYTSNFYINFFEAGDRLARSGGRVGMLVPHSFLFNKSFRDFRGDFIGERGNFEFLSEFGYGILDNATVGTVGTVIRSGAEDEQQTGRFLRLSDVEKEEKESSFLAALFKEEPDFEVQRLYERSLDEFSLVAGSPLSYWTPIDIRKLYGLSAIFDAENSDIPGRDSLGRVRQGIATGDDDRYVRDFWESKSRRDEWVPFAKGGKDTWLLPRLQYSIRWEEKGEEVRRYPGGNGTPNEHLYFRSGLTYAVAKRSGKRFGILHSKSIFGHKGGAVILNSEKDQWGALGYTGSRLFTYLMLVQTAERMWEIGMVSKVPWDPELSDSEGLDTAARKIVGGLYSLRQSNFNSPHYQGPLLHRLLSLNTKPGPAHDHHPHRDLADELSVPKPPTVGFDVSLRELGVQAERFRQSVREGIEKQAAELDRIVFDHFDINEEQRKEIYTEIAYRTIDDPRKTPSYDPEAVEEPPEDFPELVKRLLLHLTSEIVEEDDDGIVLLRAESEEEEADLMAQMQTKFQDIWGEYAEDRLQEVDEILGDRDPTDEPYPNLRRWLENDLFSFHCDEFENTPILWGLTTERLGGEGNEDVGFACLIDYHQLGSNIFDRLSARYLETRKAALRERRQSARRTAESSEGEQARTARREQQRCKNALRQIDALETKISELTQPQPRDWAAAVQDDARDLAPKVRHFRERLEERLETLDALHEEAPSSWFKDHFSDKFMESVNDNREEWIDALVDLEAACEQFARPADEPVEAHLYDLLPYFDNLVGSTHYSSNGIFFLNYYFSKGKDLADKIDQGRKSRVTRREQLVADLARETDEDIELGKEINEASQEMKKHMDADWKPRAVEEVRTPGYRPVKKHGVAINITPLAEKNLVPELVEDKVI